MKKRNFKSRLISAISAAICAVTFCAGTVSVDMFDKVEAAVLDKESKCYYIKIDTNDDNILDSVEVTEYWDSSALVIYIPAKIAGLPVKSIGDNAFACSSPSS